MPEYSKGGSVAPCVPGDVEGPVCSKRPRVGDEVFPPPVSRQVPSEACPALLGTAQVGRCSLSACVLPARLMVCIRQEMSARGSG